MASPNRTRSVPEILDVALPLALLAAGLLHPESPSTWYWMFGFAFVVLEGSILAGAALVTFVAERAVDRLQGQRQKPALIPREAFETARAMFVIATLVAWPLTQWRLGHPTAMVWDLETVGASVAGNIVQTLLGVVVIDAWLYWKHRLLHTRAMFVFHKAHHAFRDPTAFAGFAVGPVETLLTFWPVLILCIPEATHWAPLYFGLVVAFVNLNFYLHCGVSVSLLERTLPRAYINTSAFHNVHHAKADVNFGEALYLWDVLCRTRSSDRRGTASATAPVPS